MDCFKCGTGKIALKYNNTILFPKLTIMKCQLYIRGFLRIHLMNSFICLIVTLQFSSTIQAQTLAWTKKVGGNNATTNASIQGINIDGNGNLYCSVSFTGTVDFDPGPGVFNLSSASVSSCILKLDPSGNFLWAKEIPGNLKLDNAGNIYTTGSFNGTKDFDPGPGVYNLTSFGYDDIFILKIDPNGNFIWAKQVGGNYIEQGGGITISTLGTLYITGSFGYGGTISPINSADFDPDPLTSYTLTNIGGRDGFILALDLDGQFISVVQKGTPVDESVTGICTGANGDLVYIVSTSSGVNLALEKSDPSYNVLWSINLGNSSLQLAPISLDPSGNVLVSGGFSGSVDFNPGAGIASYTASTVQDPFTEKFDANGNFQWVKVIKANGFANGFVSDATGDVYSTGYFNGNGNIDFDPGPGTYNIKTSAIAMYIQKLTGAGNFVWTRQIGGEAKTNTMGRGIAVNSSFEILTSFEFNGTIDVDPGSAKTPLKSSGNKDVVIHKMTQSIPPSQKASDLIVSEISPSKTIRAYPNPNKGSFYIDVPVVGNNAKLELYDMTGKLIMSKTFNGSNEQRMFIDEKSISAGVYLLKVSGKNKSLDTKISIE